MRHFFRCGLHPDDVLARADAFFPTIGLAKSDDRHTKEDERRNGVSPRKRVFTGTLGTLTLTVRMEGGHYTFVEARTDQMGESRLDRNVKRYFVLLHRAADPSHALEAAY